MTFFLSIVLGIFILGIMVLIHELGHFLVAKAFKFKVLAFSIGFGKVLLKKTVGETEYRVSAIPFGGYVKMAGENPEEERTGSTEEFQMKPKYQRALVAVAGPVANYVSAIIMLWVMFMYGVDRPQFLDRPVVGFVSDSSAAQAAGVLAGDSIVSLNGKPVKSWDDMDSEFLTGSARYEMVLARDGATRVCLMQKDSRKGQGYSQPPFGLHPPFPPIVGNVFDTMPAARAGIMKGDTVLSIDSVPIHSWEQISYLMQKSVENKPRQVSLGRPGMRLTTSIVPQLDTKSKRFMIGITNAKAETRMERYAAGPAVGRCLESTWDFTTMIFDVLGKLVSREVSASELAGPVGIIPASGIIALQGLSPLLKFMALISVNLAVLNLFPLVITDGGVLLFLLLEAVRRRPLSLKTQLAFTRVAIVFFIVFFLYVTLNDINRLPMLFKIFGR